MSESKLEQQIAGNEMVQNALKTLGALLLACKSNHLCSEFEMADKDGQHSDRFKIEVTRIVR